MSKIFPQPCFLGYINIKEIASLNIFEGTLRTTFLKNVIALNQTIFHVTKF